MQRLDRLYIMLGLCWLIVSMVYGAWLGASHHTNFANSHAHIGLLGFVASVLFGILHWAYPAQRESRIAVWQLTIYEVGVALLIVGKVIFDLNGAETLFLQVGATLAIIGAVLMLYLFAARATDRPVEQLAPAKLR